MKRKFVVKGRTHGEYHRYILTVLTFLHDTFRDIHALLIEAWKIPSIVFTVVVVITTVYIIYVSNTRIKVNIHRKVNVLCLHWIVILKQRKINWWLVLCIVSPPIQLYIPVQYRNEFCFAGVDVYTNKTIFFVWFYTLAILLINYKMKFYYSWTFKKKLTWTKLFSYNYIKIYKQNIFRRTLHLFFVVIMCYNFQDF